MNKFSTVEEIKAYFVGSGWNKDISFHELNVEEAIEKGYCFAVSNILQNKKYFVMNDTGNVFDDAGKIAVYNIAVKADEDKPTMDMDEAMNILHNSLVGYSYDTDPARYTIRQKDLPKLFEKVNEFTFNSRIKYEEEQKKNLALDIVELFENLLDEKGIEIPCADETEQRDRYEGGNDAKLYGMEYWNIIDTIQTML